MRPQRPFSGWGGEGDGRSSTLASRKWHAASASDADTDNEHCTLCEDGQRLLGIEMLRAE